MKVYSDPKGRPGKWRCKLPDGRFKTITASTKDQAIVQAELLCTTGVDKENAWLTLVNQHITRRDPDMREVAKWRGYQYMLRAFARAMVDIAQPGTVQMGDFLTYWDGLGRHQQDNLKPEWNKFIKWTMLSGAITLPANPVDLLDKKRIPVKKRQRINHKTLALVIKTAERKGLQGLINACRLSYLTALRRADLAGLTWDTNINDGKLQATISKSMASRGTFVASRLSWDFSVHEELREVIKNCKHQATLNRDCPFVLSHFHTKGVVHPCAVTPDWLTKQFTEVIREVLPGVEDHPTFHEIRSLSAASMEQQGIELDDIKSIMAHTDAATTGLYLTGHEKNFMDVSQVVFLGSELQ